MERMRIARACLALLSWLAAGCSEGSTGDDGRSDAVDAGDVGGDGIEVTPPAAPAPPAPPEPPRLTACPAGWREVPGEGPDGVATCDPWPEGGATECAATDEAHFPGEAGCVRVGTACPVGDWAEGLPTGVPIAYVRAGAPAGGDGSEAAPFATISAAVLAPAPGTVVAVGKGTYDEMIVVPAGVTLWGACAAETVVGRLEPDTRAGTIMVWGRDVVVRNLRLGGDRVAVWASGAGRSVTLRDVVIDGAEDLGIYVSNGAAVTGEGVVVRGTRSRSSDGETGGAVWVANGGRLDLARGVFERNRDVAALVADPGSTLLLADVAVRDTESRVVDRGYGGGLEVGEGASAELRRTVFERNRDFGLFVIHAGARLVASDLIVRDTRSGERTLRWGRGLVLQDGGTVEIERALLERNREYCLSVKDSGSSLTAADVVVRDTASVELTPPVWGLGLVVSDEGRAELTRALFERNRTFAVHAAGGGTVLGLTDVTIRDTRVQESDGEGGAAIEVEDGPAVDVERALLDGNVDIAVYARGAGTTVALRDAVVRGTQARPSDGDFGRGLGVEGGAAVDVERALFEANRDLAAYASGAGSTLRLTDVEILGTESRVMDDAGGWGLGWALGAQGEGTRVRLSGNREVGLAAFDPGTVVRLEDLDVRGTLERSCAADSCPGQGAGIGLGAYGGAALDVTRFVLADSALCGVQIARGRDPDTGVPLGETGTMDLHDGEVFGNPVGANVQVPEFDVARLSDRVLFHDNDRNLDSTELPLPGSVPPP